MSSGPAAGSAVSTYVRRRSAWPRSAAALRAVTTHGTTPPATGTGASAGRCAPAADAAVGACSSTACALVPLMPNEETAARRGRPVTGHSRASVNNRTAPPDQSTCDDGSSACRVRGSRPCRSAITILMTPAMPAADWVWPMLDLTEPSSSASSGSRSRP
ncbi:hypothetical protein SAZ_40850 [Streptomyces noursei ZPM]|nr:hypothetical protein SAZ_40850 [Streptomyces noursei ZPM]